VSKRKRAPAGDSELLSALELLRERRAPYADLIAAIVGDTLADTLRDGPAAREAPLVEIGAGSGQLRAWLPPAARARAIHTDPSGPALRLLRAAAPEAQTRVAAADELPFADGGVGGVLGLCVFDAVVAGARDDAAAAVREIARVLAPGAPFVHFLDMATLLEGPFAKLAASELIPIPNLFSDPAETEWPLDIVLLRRDWLAGLLELSARAGHPLSSTFGRLFDAFLGARFDADRATALFKAVASDGASRQALLTQLVSAARLSFANGYPPLKPLPFHSGKVLASQLETSFRDSGAFAIERSQIATRAAWRARPPGDTVLYRSLCVGHQRIADELPRRLLTSAAAARVAAEGMPAGEALVEAGVFVFVARRL
jgi:SAM-dependent methyltransferase